MNRSIRTLGNRILVQRFDTQTDRIGNIYIPDSAKERPNQGDVIAIGPGKMYGGLRVPMEVAVGDKILFGKYSGSEVKLDGKELLIVREEEILGVME